MPAMSGAHHLQIPFLCCSSQSWVELMGWGRVQAAGFGLHSGGKSVIIFHSGGPAILLLEEKAILEMAPDPRNGAQVLETQRGP